MNGNTLWTRSYVLNNTVCFIINIAYYMLMVIMADYAVNRFGASLSQAGFAAGAFIVGALLARLLLGGQIERIGLKRSACLGTVVFLAGLTANLFVNSVTGLSAVRVIQGIGFGIGSTTTGAIMARMVPEARRGEGTSYYAMFVTLATAVGPYAGASLYDGNGLTTDILASGLLLAVCLVVIRFISIPHGVETRDAAVKEHHTGIFSTFFEPKAIPIALITFLVSLGFAGILGFIATYERETGLTEAGRYFFVFYALFTLVSRPVTGRLFDSRGASFVMYPAFLIFGAGLFVFAFASNGWMLLAVAACLGIGFGTYMSCAQAITIMVSPSNRVGVATSTFFIFMDLGVGFGPSLMGLIVPCIGFRGLYIILSIVQFACAALYWLLVARKTTKCIRPVPSKVRPMTSATVPISTVPVITISREYGSGGHEIGELIARHLHIPCYDQQIIEKIAADGKYASSYVSNEEQRIDHAALYRLYAWYAYSFPAEGGWQTVPERLFELDREIITGLARQGSCVIVGRLANYILKEHSHTFNLFIHASEESKINRVVKRDHIGREEAKEKICRVNSQRAKHCEYFTHTKWGEARNYHLTICSDLYGIQNTALLLTNLLKCEVRNL